MSSFSCADETMVGKAKCGDTFVEIIGVKYEDLGHALKRVTIHMSNRNREKTTNINTEKLERPYLSAACIFGKNREPYIVYQNYSGCSDCDDSQYGIIDTVSLNTILQSSASFQLSPYNNRKETSKILGFKAPDIFTDERCLFDRMDGKQISY